ncbi:MAG: Methyltransferase type 11 [Myxococcales bacterium]|nr:Methyltransferase type 11 [Myxococcales bacterium]
MGSRVYAGRTASTRQERVVYSCPCGERFAAAVWRGVDIRDSDEAKRLIDGSLNRVRCPSCEAGADVQVPVVFHDGAAGRLVLVLPDGLRHRELKERAALFTQLADDGVAPTAYVLEPQVVFGSAGLRALLAPPSTEASFDAASDPQAQAAVRTAEQELIAPAPRPSPADKTPTPQPLPRDNRHPSLAKLPSLKDEETPLPSPSWVPAPVERRLDDSDRLTRPHVTVPDPRAAVTERWIAGREGPSAFLVEDEVLLCAGLPPAALEGFLPGYVELRVQLHRLPSYPLIALTLLALDPPVGPSRPRPEEARVLSLPLDIARAAHRVVLEALGRRCTLSLELYDSQYLPVIAHTVTAPLEENVRRLVAEAKDALERLAPATRSFERARVQFASAGYDRLGRTPIDLPDREDALDRPGLVRAALSTVARWSEPNAEAYLVEIRSLPLTEWRLLRARVVRRALDVGIAVPRLLVERTVKEHAAPLPSWTELLELQVKRFTEVAARLKPNDLSATEEADNWEHLMRECSLAGVVIDEQVRKLAQSSLKRARVGSAGGGVDLRTLATAELTALLEQKDLRREAAVILCERRETPTLPAVFSAIRRMTRNEANVVLPSVTRFGTAGERWLLEGLKSKKSYMRQGCALALATLKSPPAIEALCKLLVVEPTEIWGEVARALGDVGAAAVAPLSALVREVDLDERDRVVEALAHAAARGGAQARQAVETLAAGRDGLVAGAAQRALARVAEVRAADAEMRRAQQEGTVVRGFSRRFYEVLGGASADSGAVELSPADLEEVDDDEVELAVGGTVDEEEESVTSNSIPALRLVNNDAESTNPTPKSTLPRGRG